MSFQQPIRHQRLKLSPEGIINRIDILVESTSIVESSLRSLVADVHLPDQVLEKVQYGVSLSRRQIACLNRAIKSAEELNEP